MNYRLYTPDDFAALYAIEEVCFQPPTRFSRSYMRQLVNSHDTTTWIAEEGGQMAGFAVVDWVDEADEIIGYIETLEVAPDRRRQGVARELLRLIDGSARKASVQHIWLHVDANNAGALRLYEANGHICEGREENYYPQGHAALIYCKTLEAKRSA